MNNLHIDHDVNQEQKCPSISIKRVVNLEDLDHVCDLHYKTYSKSLTGFAGKLKSPEDADYENNIVLLLQEKETGIPLATIRIHTNLNRPLPLQSVVTLPDLMRNSMMSEAVRFCVSSEINAQTRNFARNLLLKAYFKLCIANKIEWIVIAARSPLYKIYSKLLFDDISPNGEFVRLPYVNDIPHRIMRIRVDTVKSPWDRTNHPLYDFFFNTTHPDLDVMRI